MQEITTDKLYHLTINSEYIPLPNEAINPILTALAVERIAKGPLTNKIFPLSRIYREIDWKWMSDRGTLTKRINKWLHDNLDMSISSPTLSAIGNIVREHIVKNQEYHIDFTQSFKWRDGQFADSGSCFWDSRSEARYNMQDSGKFYAVRFFRKNDPGSFIKYIAKVDPKNDMFYVEEDRYFYSGIARAWVYVDIIERENLKFPVWIIFNGYGIGTKQIASIVSSFHGESVKKINVTNNGGVHGGLYINGAGYLVGPESIIKDKESFDFAVPYGCESKRKDAGKFKVRKLVDRKAPRPDEVPRAPAETLEMRSHRLVAERMRQMREDSMREDVGFDFGSLMRGVGSRPYTGGILRFY